MKPFTLIILLCAATLAATCKKSNEQEDTNCYAGFTTVRQLVNRPAIVKQTNPGEFYIIEPGTYDTRLRPCNLPPAFQVADLNVIVSGDVKAIPWPAYEPCCTEGLVITSISR